MYHLWVVEEWKSLVWIGGRGYQLPGCATKSARFQAMYVSLSLTLAALDVRQPFM